MWIFCLTNVIVACSYVVSNSWPVVQSELFCLKTVIVACWLSSYVCACPELETAYMQAIITAERKSRESLEKKDFIMFRSIGFFTIRKSDAFLSDYLTDLKLHNTKKIVKNCPSGVWTHNPRITTSAPTHEQSQQATITAFIQNISLWKAGNKLETACEQATIRAVKQNISLWNAERVLKREISWCSVYWEIAFVAFSPKIRSDSFWNQFIRQCVCVYLIFGNPVHISNQWYSKFRYVDFK